MIKRGFDIVFSILILTIFFPFIILIALLIKLDSKGSAFFIQERVGKDNVVFNIYKFRTMYEASQSKGLLTLGNHDSRITKIGYYLRRYKIDEFPQIINVLIGNMSFVGPRPELRHYVNIYKEEDYVVFSIKPGITSLASLKYINEAELLKTAKDPEDFFVNAIIPDKLKLDKEYIKNQNFLLDIKIISLSIYKALFK